MVNGVNGVNSFQHIARSKSAGQDKGNEEKVGGRSQSADKSKAQKSGKGLLFEAQNGSHVAHDLEAQKDPTEATSLLPGPNVGNNIASRCCLRMADLFEKCSCATFSTCFSSAYEHKGKLAIAFVTGAAVAVGIMCDIANSKSSGNPSDNQMGPILCDGMNLTTILGVANQMVTTTRIMVDKYIATEGTSPLDLYNVTACVGKYAPELQDTINSMVQWGVDIVNQ